MNCDAPAQNETGPCEILLPELCDAASAPALKETLARLLNSPGVGCTLAGTAVQRISTACVQLMLAADRALARRNGQGLRLRNSSEPLQAAFADLGLSDVVSRWLRDGVADHG